MGRLQVRWAAPTFKGPTSPVRHTVAVLFLMAGPTVTTILPILLLFRWVSSLPIASRLVLTLLTGSTRLRSIRHTLRHLWACLNVRMLWGALII